MGSFGQRGEPKNSRPKLDRDGKEQRYDYKRCKKNHLGRDSVGSLVEYNFSHKKGHLKFECYRKKGNRTQ